MIIPKKAQLFLKIFFGIMVLIMISWYLCMKLLFTRRCVESSLRDIGVSRSKTSRAFAELKRKSFHLAGILIPLIYFIGLQYQILNQRLASFIMIIITVFLWFIELGRNVSSTFRNKYNEIFGSMLRKSELRHQKKLTGTGFFFLGNCLCVVLFHPIIAIASMLYLILGDLAAALVGVSFGRTKIFGKKSLEGTFACFVVCCLVGIICGSLTASLVELFNPAYIDDNVSLPVASAVALHLALIRIGGAPQYKSIDFGYMLQS